jgi:GNAT superfamily N-acetyltransferase
MHEKIRVSNVRFEQATVEDAVSLANLRWDFRTEDGEIPVVDRGAFVETCATFFREGIASGEWVVWAAWDAATIISHQCVRIVRPVPRPCSPNDAFGYLTNVYTVPAYRGRGIGGELLARIRAWADQEGLELLLVSPGENAIHFYERGGFEAASDFLQLRLKDWE